MPIDAPAKPPEPLTDDVAEWELFWAKLLAEYQAVCQEMDQSLDESRRYAELAAEVD